MRRQSLCLLLLVGACSSNRSPSALLSPDPAVLFRPSPTPTPTLTSTQQPTDERVEVPFLLYGTLAEAKRALKALGLRWRIVYRKDDLFGPGTVINQAPPFGMVKPGRIIKIVVVKKTPCAGSYPDVCIPPPPPDLDCADIPYRNFRVNPPDPHGFDGYDNDGRGCET